jgi:hypothetical protein
MTDRDKDDEIRSVAAQLDARMDELTATVAALTAILTHPVPPESGEADERLVKP